MGPGSQTDPGIDFGDGGSFDLSALRPSSDGADVIISATQIGQGVPEYSLGRDRSRLQQASGGLGIVRLHVGVGALLVTAAVSGCTIVPGLRVSEGKGGGELGYVVTEITPQVIVQSATSSLTEALAVEAVPEVAVPGEYVIGPGDVIAITVWDHPELNNPAGETAVSGGRLVSADGMMFYPFVGLFKAQGMTVRQVREHLTKSLTRVIQNPQVDVQIAAFRSQRVQVTGEVGQPGMVMLNDTVKGVLDAINERGGLSATASRREAILVRGGTRTSIDLAGLLSGSRPGSNVTLMPGDVVHVPDASNSRVFMLGEVTTAKAVTLSQSGMSLIEALTDAGGLFRATADDSGVLVFRRAKDATDKPVIYTLKLGTPEGMLLAGEFKLAPRDVVYVKATKFTQYNLVIQQLLPTVTYLYQYQRLADSNLFSNGGN